MGVKWVPLREAHMRVCEPKGVLKSHENPLVWGTFLGIVLLGFFFGGRSLKILA